MQIEYSMSSSSSINLSWRLIVASKAIDLRIIKRYFVMKNSVDGS